uniref:Hsp90 co-chaperone Cdc37 n=1 Tax=Panthera leo TaxID=9689 RepID=A0A8C8X9S5_PANLE
MVDYSVWDHIEVSDHEDKTHPKIDTASLFHWRHQARVERMEQFSRLFPVVDFKLWSEGVHGMISILVYL